MTKILKNPVGLTLVELLVAMLLSMTALGLLERVFRSQTHTVTVQQNRQDVEEYARSVMDMMVREMRITGYNPKQTNSGANCAGTPTAGSPGVASATATLFKFTADYRGTTAGSVSDGDCNDADEEISYQYQAPGPQSCPTGMGDIVRTASGSSESITDCNVQSVAFDYYEQNSSTAMSPIVPANIQRVKITLTLQSKKPDQQFGGQLTTTVYTNVSLRNRGL